MSPLTPDERAAAVGFLRAIETGVGGERLSAVLRAKARELADRLEAEPEPRDWRRLRASIAERAADIDTPADQFPGDKLIWLSNLSGVIARDTPLLLAERDALLRRLDDERSSREEHDLCTVTGDVWAAETESRERAERERDEAREALRELAEVAERVKDSPDDLMARLHLSLVLPRANEILEGGERTHTLVPNTVLELAAEQMRVCRVPRLLPETFAAAARGENVTWPGDNA